MKPISSTVLPIITLGLALTAAPGSARAVKGELPPDFTGATLDGRKFTLSDFRGKNPVLLSFYADFVPPCRGHFRHLKELDEKFTAQGLRTVAVSLDEDRAAAAAIPNQTRVRFPVVFDPKAGIGARYSVQAMPHTVVIDRMGKVQAVVTGVDAEAIEKAVTQVMK
jgi:peroxiredoxin